MVRTSVDVLGESTEGKKEMKKEIIIYLRTLSTIGAWYPGTIVSSGSSTVLD